MSEQVEYVDLQASIKERQLRTEKYRKKYANLFVMKETPLLLRVHSFLRDRSLSRPDFLFYADQLIRLLTEFAFSVMDYKEKKVTTPTGNTFSGLELTKELIGVSIMRAGESMEHALRSTVRGVKLGKILIQRDETSPQKEAKLFYSKLPENIKDYVVVLMDPMLASGSSACLAVQVLIEKGVNPNDIIFINLIAAPEGLDALFQAYPKIRVVTTMIDEGLNEAKFIVPGIGDFGDRYFGT